MNWTDDVATDWDEAAADPPRADVEPTEMTWTDDGFVLAPADADTEAKRANAVFSTVDCKVGNEPADREFGPERPPRDSPEAER
jgi:hypothetical protein